MGCTTQPKMKDFLSKIPEGTKLNIGIRSTGERYDIIVGPQFDEREVILAYKAEKISQILLNTNLPPIDYSRVYWTTSKYFYGLTIFADKKAKPQNAIILIDMELFPYGEDFSTGQIVKFGSTIVHEKFHYLFLTKDPETSKLTDEKIEKEAKKLYEQKIILKNKNCNIKNKLDLLICTNGFNIRK